MDALIMAAGRGSRLGPLTDDRPKALVDLGGITPLELQLDLLADRGVERAIIVTGYRRRDVEASAARRIAGRMQLDMVWNPFWRIANVISSAWLARDRIRGEFIYLHADTVFEPGILDDLLSTSGPVRLPIDFRAVEPEQMKARIVDGRVVYLSKELDEDSSAGEFIGIGVFRADAVPQVVAGIEQVMEAGDHSAYFEAALNVAIDAGLDVVPVATNGRAWAEIDFPDDLAGARAMLPRLRSERTSS
jgi:choline kinase